MAQLCPSDETPVLIRSNSKVPMVKGTYDMDFSCLTLRSQLDKKKSDIYPEINRSVRIREGAEHMLHMADAPANVFTKAHRTKIESVLEVESAAICTLKDKMDVLNSKFSAYQKLESRLPVIPIGLKATQPIDFKTHLSPFIASHYDQDATKFSRALDQLTFSRSKIMEPQRSISGLDDFKSYYRLFNTVERRFFDESVHHGFRFSWSDSFTGYRHTQRSPAFEKGSLIFNYAALCSQIAAACGTESADSLSKQTKWFVEARANLQVLLDSFAHAPSRDMSPDLLRFLMRIMQLQAQESVFLRQMLECQNESRVAQLVKYIGGAGFLSEGYGKVATPIASAYDDAEGSQVTAVIPPSWLKLLEVKSQYYQAQMNYKLAVVLLCLATDGKLPNTEPFEVKPLPVEGLFSNDDFLDAEVGRQLTDLFTMLKPYIKLRRDTPRTSRRKLHHRRRRHGPSANGDTPRPMSRIKRSFSSISLSGLGRSKSRTSEDLSLHGGRFSSMSMHSGYSSDSAVSMPNLVGLGEDLEGEVVAPPSNRKDAHLLGQACLAEALSWARSALHSIEQSSDLNGEANFKAFVGKDVDMWAEQLSRVTNGNSNSNPGPVKKPRNKWLFRSRSFSRSTANADTASVVSTTSVTSRKSSAAAKKAEANPWTGPTFLPAEIELPKDLCCSLLKSGKNTSLKVDDPFHELGPIKYFNAQKRWLKPYSVQLVRDDKVVYGFSIQGTGPVEILGVDADTPASEYGMRTGDLVVGINGMDARFMTHNQAVAAIRFGAEGYDRALRAQAAADENGECGVNGENVVPTTFPLEVDVVKLTLVRPIPPDPKPTDRRPSIYLSTSDPSTPTPTNPTALKPTKSFGRRSKSKPRALSRNRFLSGNFKM